MKIKIEIEVELHEDMVQNLNDLSKHRGKTDTECLTEVVTGFVDGALDDWLFE